MPAIGLDHHQLTLKPTFRIFQVDFDDIETVSDNPDFRIRIRFDGDPGLLAADNGNRVTFKNFSIGSEKYELENTRSDDTGDENDFPLAFRLDQNYPNPFNPVTVIAYALPEQSWVRLTVFDLLGREVAVLVDEIQNGGQHTATWNARDIASGLYVSRLEAGGTVLTRSMTLIK